MKIGNHVILIAPYDGLSVGTTGIVINVVSDSCYVVNFTPIGKLPKVCTIPAEYVNIV